ncbi:hypothetical protein BB559_002016 [Furculomyces boomerangus]|uniref:acetyl-CoA C-acetyltransferase n=1 Tax=Furculomyces boomerangus TaxID=61424 RepID=A0A2T9YYT8_9FUNG|nr:hypothetical protein BB559_002016 [Furculomyces boomerangus]
MTLIQDNGAYIVSYGRTPIGSFIGSLSSLSAIDLGVVSLKGALEKASIPATEVDSIFLGNVVSANLGQNPARQVALGAGCDKNRVVGTNVNKVCASGAKATMLAAMEIHAGISDVVAVVGTESMSNIPYFSPNMRAGSKFGNANMIDGVVVDGLMDAYNKQMMGYAAEKCGVDHSISREEQDQFAIGSYNKSIAASKSGKFDSEIIPTPLKARRGAEPKIVSKDEEILKFDSEKLKALRPAFPDTKGSGTVTAGNASSLSDGAAAMIVVSGRRLKQLYQQAQEKSATINAFYIAGFADAEQEPVNFTTTPTVAIQKALSQNKALGYTAGSSNINDFVDYVEINEAFSVVGVANTKLLGLDENKVNVHGGAVALGHPLGCSGARIIVSLCNILQLNNGKRGIAAVCNGGGGASAVIIEQV